MADPKTLLVVDDEEALRHSLVTFLEDSGFQCLASGDGAEALAIFQARRPDAVLTDLRMPGLDGLSLVKRIHGLSPATPIVVLTGTGDWTAGEDVLAAGAGACLFKPIPDLQVVVDALHALFQGRMP